MGNAFGTYDSTDPISIEKYAQQLIGKTFSDICYEDSRVEDSSAMSEILTSDNSGKGSLGQVIEERFFHYTCNSESAPDFAEAGVELKVTPYKENKDGSISAKERLSLSMINYFDVVNEKFQNSHVWKKCRLMLLVYYLYNKDIVNKQDYQIHFAKLFTPPEEDIKIIEHDYEVIVNKIKQGKAHELSEGDTLYLGAAPKAQKSTDRRPQPFSNELAKPRAFVYKQGYMTNVLNKYLAKDVQTYEPIMSENSDVDLETFVTSKIAEYKGWSIQKLCKYFGIDAYTKQKNLSAIIAYRILGIKGNKAAEFVKANIVIKTIRIQENDRIKESMSFPAIKFKELAQETWDDSTFGNYLRETRFLFVVYKFDAMGELILQGCQFWNIPYSNLENDVKAVWERTQRLVQGELEFHKENGKYVNNFPGMKDNIVCHVRPHARDSSDTDALPDGRRYPKQCFWLSNKYIYTQINDDLKGLK